MTGDGALFDRALERALGESLESLMAKYAAAVERGDLERVRLLDEMLRVAVALGSHAVAAAWAKRKRVIEPERRAPPLPTTES